MADEKKFRIYLCGGPNCTAKGRDQLLRALEDELWACELEDAVDLRVSNVVDVPNVTVSAFLPEDIFV